MCRRSSAWSPRSILRPSRGLVHPWRMMAESRQRNNGFLGIFLAGRIAMCRTEAVWRLRNSPNGQLRESERSQGEFDEEVDGVCFGCVADVCGSC